MYSKPKITIISASFYPAVYYGGPIFSSYELAKGLAEADFIVYVATTNANGGGELDVKTNKYLKLKDNLFVKYYGLAARNGFSLFMFSLLWLDIYNSDIVYLISIFSPHTPLAIILCAIFNKKLIISPRGQLGNWCIKQGSGYKSIWLKLFIKPFLDKMVFHVTSFQEKEQLVSLFPNANYYIVPNGINISELPLSQKNNLFFKKYNKNINAESKIIVSLGRIHSKKGFDILINAFNLVKNNLPNIFLFIAGEDYGEKEHLNKIIGDLNLNNSVILMGPIEGEEKVNYLRNANVFALASYDENFGMVYAESLSLGTPIVASKNTPWEDVEKYNCGKWVDNTQEAFAKAIVEICNSDSALMGINARKFIEECYSSKGTIKKFINELNKLSNAK